ncbi:MAG: fatty acid desaturase, partial [Burkholderiales bacterium]
RNVRWFKLLYCTPALIPLYFRAAASEGRSYPPELRRTIMIERLATVAFQLSVAFILHSIGGWGVLARVWAVPYFLVFPVAFTLNRLGQHYDIDPTHPLKWSTVMAPSRLWDFLFVYSNYHAEHHYFPSVPFYNLRKLHLRLRPLYKQLGIQTHTYREIVWEWFVKNRPPHADWDKADGSADSPRVTTARTAA